MNDRFKFRLYDKKIKEMIYADNKTQNNINIINFLIYCNNAFIDWDIENYALMQSTGLKDKNGKLIYEGDILGDIYESLYVYYCNQCKQFQLYSQGYGCMACNGDIHWIEVVEDDKKLKVIGNIYENEDLLKCENQ